MPKIARVFPTKTSFTPTDAHAYYDTPDLFTAIYDEVHVSCTFTWDMDRAEWLKEQWKDHGKKVLVGGCAYGSYAGEFVSGKYLRNGITITSRGCPNKCSFCFVPTREGELRELPIVAGNIIQDNNILACSPKHFDAVVDMLKTQKNIEFKGGLEARRVTKENADKLRSLKIRSLWLACDTDGAVDMLGRAVTILKSAGFTRNHLMCYVLIGDDIVKNEARLREVWKIGCMPFAQLYKPKEYTKEYTKEYKQFARKWSRPAIIRSMMTINEREKSK